MNEQSQDLKAMLLQTDAEFHQLATQHHELDDRLHELTLKKRKLALKDRMETILRQHREEQPH